MKKKGWQIHPDPAPPKPGAKLGSPRKAWYFLTGLALLALCAGLFSYYNEEHYGTIVTGMRTPGYGGASWGLYIVFVVYFIGVSFAGITVAALARLFDIAVLKPVSRIAELLTLVALIAGAACVVADLGRPDVGIQNLPRFANPSSPFFGTFTLVVSGYMFSSLVFFFLAGRADAAHVAEHHSRGLLRIFHRAWASGFKDEPEHHGRHRRVSFWLSLGILPLLVTAHSTLGFVFGIQAGRPGWFSTLQAPGFVILAGVSGTGMVILVALAFRWLFRLREQIPDASIRWLGNFLWVLALVYLYFMIVEELTATYAAPHADREMAHEIVSGRFASLFWTTAGSLMLTFLIPFLLYVRNRTSVGWVAFAAAASNVAAICKRFLIVVPSQTHGGLVRFDPGEYTPTWVELGVVLGLAGLMFTLMLVFGKIFPLVPAPHPHHQEQVPAGSASHRWRLAATAACAAIALAMIIFGLTDAFRLWSGTEVDNRIPFSPVIFAGGVMLLFISAIVYEVIPEKRISTWEDRKQANESLAPFAWHDQLAEQAEQMLGGGDFRMLARLAEQAEDAIRDGDMGRALTRLRELQKLAAESSVRQTT